MAARGARVPAQGEEDALGGGLVAGQQTGEDASHPRVYCMVPFVWEAKN